MFLHFFHRGDRFYNQYINTLDKKILDDDGSGLKPNHTLQRRMKCRYRKYFENSNPSTFAPGNNEKYDAQKNGESSTKMSGKQLKTYCGKCNKGKKIWGLLCSKTTRKRTQTQKQRISATSTR